MKSNTCVTATDILTAAKEMVMNNTLPSITSPISVDKAPPYNSVRIKIKNLSAKRVVEKIISKLSNEECIPKNIIQEYETGTFAKGEVFGFALKHKEHGVIAFQVLLDITECLIVIQLGNADIFKQ